MKTQVLEGATLPPPVRDFPTPPERLYLVGELPRGPAVAIVGTRQPTRGAAAFARELAGELAAAGVTVLSGGALGIDAAAHRGALDVGGKTVVVAPSSFERPYPEEHAELFRLIVSAGGAYITREPPGTAAGPAKFFLRNGLMVALAQAVVIVEAGYRSGARNAAKQARALGRLVFAVPSVPWNPRGRGCILELVLGARPLISAAEVLKALRGQHLHPIATPAAAELVVRTQLSLHLDPVHETDGAEGDVNADSSSAASQGQT